MKIHPQGELFC